MIHIQPHLAYLRFVSFGGSWRQHLGQQGMGVGTGMAEGQHWAFLWGPQHQAGWSEELSETSLWDTCCELKNREGAGVEDDARRKVG